MPGIVSSLVKMKFGAITQVRTMGVGRICSWGAIGDLSRGDEKLWNLHFPTRNLENNLFSESFNLPFPTPNGALLFLRPWWGPCWFGMHLCKISCHYWPLTDVNWCSYEKAFPEKVDNIAYYIMKITSYAISGLTAAYGVFPHHLQKKEYWRNYKNRNQTSLISEWIPKPETQTKSKMVGVLFSELLCSFPTLLLFQYFGLGSNVKSGSDFRIIR